MFGPEETDDINDTPTVLEYKRLRRVMRIMIKFYEDGSQNKSDQADDVAFELQKVCICMHARVRSGGGEGEGEMRG